VRRTKIEQISGRLLKAIPRPSRSIALFGAGGVKNAAKAWIFGASAQSVAWHVDCIDFISQWRLRVRRIVRAIDGFGRKGQAQATSPRKLGAVVAMPAWLAHRCFSIEHRSEDGMANDDNPMR
jgi:hypothetical protein